MRRTLTACLNWTFLVTAACVTVFMGIWTYRGDVLSLQLIVPQYGRERHAHSMESTDDVLAANMSAAKLLLSAGRHERSQLIRGLVFTAFTERGQRRNTENALSWSVIASFSPFTEDHVRLMLEDKFSECRLYAMGPAIARWNGTLVANIRVWLAQFLYALKRIGAPPVESWQENYVYSLKLSEDYQPIGKGRLLGIPTPTNSGWKFRKGGAMDPRSFVFKNRLFLVYYSYGAPISQGSSVGTCRMYLWDYGNSLKTLLVIRGFTLQDKGDINWVPTVVKDSLYFVYSFDPLRVIRCDPDSGDCTVIYTQVPVGERMFSQESDHLRGGTPFVEYEYPYFLSVAHSSLKVANKSMYDVNLVVLRVEPWRIVYVSENVAANETWLRSTPLIAESWVYRNFWYPTALILRDMDTIDVGCHLNDHSSHVVRLRGLWRLMRDVIGIDRLEKVSRQPGPVGAIQQFVKEDYERLLNATIVNP